MEVCVVHIWMCEYAILPIVCYICKVWFKEKMTLVYLSKNTASLYKILVFFVDISNGEKHFHFDDFVFTFLFKKMDEPKEVGLPLKFEEIKTWKVKSFKPIERSNQSLKTVCNKYEKKVLDLLVFYRLKIVVNSTSKVDSDWKKYFLKIFP